MTLREIFETVKAHLLAQGKQAADENGQCLYRAPGGLKCAVGCLIPDELYTQKTFRQPLVDVLNAAGIPGAACDLLLDLQNAHDFSGNWLGDMDGLRGELKRIERKYFSTVTVED